MTEVEEVIRQTRACVRRLGDMETQFTVTGQFSFPSSGTFMAFMDALHRAQHDFEHALRQLDTEQEE